MAEEEVRGGDAGVLVLMRVTHPWRNEMTCPHSS